MFRDVRHAFRLIRRHPGHALTVLLTLAVAIGVGTVVIALADRIVLRPLPFRDSERVMQLWETNPQTPRYHSASHPNVRDWAAMSKTFDAMALARSHQLTMDTPSGSKSVASGVATAQWFAIHSLRPALGRFFREDEMRVGSNHVVILSYKMWRSDFGGDPGVLQRQLRLEGEPYQIIGVLPDRAWIYELDYAKLWIPLSAMHDEVENRSWRGFIGLGRLAPGVPLATARQELETIRERLAKTYPNSNAGWEVGMEPLRDAVAGPVRKMIFVFAAAIAVVLIIACANIANLALAFNSWRTREFSLRYAVGAGTSRIARQILVESIVLALLGGALGLAIAHSGLTLFKAVAPDDIPRLDEVAIDPRIALLTVALSVVTALLFGILPARAAARSGVASGNRSTGPGTDLRKALVVGELALAFVLVIATGLMTRAFARLADWEPGFRADGVSEIWCIAKNLKVPDAVEMFDRAARDIETIPGVTRVGQSSAGPLFGGTEESEMRVVGGSAKGGARWYDVSPDYLRALGVPLLRGRELRDSDVHGSEPVALINEAMARRYWPNADPIGARVELDKHQWTIVGVVGNVHPLRPDEAPQPEIFWPKRQFPRLATYFVIRSALPPATLEREVKEVVAKQAPALELSSMHTLNERAKEQRVSPRFNVIVVSILSILAFVLAAIGIYGVVSFSIVSRTREIAIRLAIGADPRRVVREIVAGGGRMLAAGLLIGIAAAIALARFLSAFLFGLSPFDPLTWLGVSLAFALVVMTACWLPARRAAAIDPATSLRAE
ncbi:MAG TPA: ABC transporter permease [Thermoanaerobaculia bacterium]|nr:ABC transporter permease [Thermoanaerobaculia bacterium]